MEKPQRSFIMYLVAVYHFFITTFSVNVLRHSQNLTNSPESKIFVSRIVVIGAALAILFFVQLIRYNKTFVYLTAFIFASNALNFAFVIINNRTWITNLAFPLFLDVCCIAFLLSKQTRQKCSQFAQYYAEQKERKNLLKRLK